MPGVSEIRIAFLVDGYNLYYSLRDASERLGLAGAGTRWLDVRAFCQSYLPAIDKRAMAVGFHYFTAIAHHLDTPYEQATVRHRHYLECLHDRGVTVHLGHFKERWHVCPTCETRFMRHEEKETDVAMGSKLLELFSRDECDGAVLVSGDSDIAPAVRAATRLFPTKRVYSCFPYRRRSALLGTIVRKAFRVSLQRYGRFQLPDPVVLTSGLRIRRPAGW